MTLRLKFLALTFLCSSLALSLDTSYVSTYVRDTIEFPDNLEGSTLKTWLTEDTYPEGKLYIEDKLLTQEDMDSILRNLNLESVNENVKASFGWTLKRTYMKLYPLDKRVHKGNKQIDYNLYTLLEPFTFLVILHESLDKKWYYVHAPFMRGWVKKEDIFISSRDELKRVKSLNFLVVLKDRLSLGNIEWGMGSKVPYLEKEENTYRILLPDGKSVWIENGNQLSDGFLSFSTERAQALFESLLGTPYGWGGLDGNKDCSSYVRDAFSVFGIDLPRNSAQQMLIGQVIATKFNSFDEMKEVLRTSPAFKTLLFMKGHVMVYGGMQDDDIVIYHAVHSITKDSGQRVHINKVVKNYMVKDGLVDLYKKIISVNVIE